MESTYHKPNEEKKIINNNLPYKNRILQDNCQLLLYTYIYKLFLKKVVKSVKVLGKHAKHRLTLYYREKVLGKKQEFCLFFRKTMEATMQLFYIKI